MVAVIWERSRDLLISAIELPPLSATAAALISGDP